MSLEQYEGRVFPATYGTDGTATVEQADTWLMDWATIGGGVSIDRDYGVNSWRFADVTSADTAEDYAETALLHDLEHTPGLADAVRMMLSTIAGLMAERAIHRMGIAA